MHRPGPLATLIAVALVGAGCSSESASSSSGGTTPSTSTTACVARVDQRDVPYVEGGDPLQRLDLYVPEAGCEPVPVVVWVHGGAWTIGDKSNAMDDKVDLWTGAGWAVASVNYRLTDLRAPEAERLMAPAHNEDVAAAVAWLVTQAPELGIDPDRIALLGHSAGAGIVAAVGADPTYLAGHDLAPDDLRCVAPLDTEGFDVANAVGDGGTIQQLYLAVFGDDPDEWRALSPITHLGEAAVPDHLLVRRGATRRHAQVAAYANAIEDAGGDVIVVDLPSFDHEDVNRRIGEPTDDVFTPELQKFLGVCLDG